jgi:putative (di)nucleoside polyphosphate hydrolase
VDAVIEFKRDVYERALAELSRFLRGVESREAYLTRTGRPQELH